MMTRVASLSTHRCGKSSVAQLLTRLYAPEEGRIFIDDIDINDIDPAYLRVLVRRSLSIKVKPVAVNQNSTVR